MATVLQVRPPSSTTPLAGAPSPVVVVGGDLVGQTIGSYRVVSELGQGGMGRVYLAEHTLIGRKAAVKVLNPDIASDPEVVSRFFTEARAVNDIRHPNIVEVTDFGQFGAFHCIVMEYLEGETLAARLRRVRTFDEPAVVRIMKQCTAALGAAHEQGLVHRDIKPENIFLRDHPDYPDFVKLLDFGIAKLLGLEANVGHHTKTGSVLGTPSYMSPEQCLGESALDTRSDVYSLGVVIYEMLTGQLPFSGDTLGRLIVCHVSEPPVPPSVINPRVSRAMNDVVLRAMQKKPKDRFQSAPEMREALERVLGPAPHGRAMTPAFGIGLAGHAAHAATQLFSAAPGRHAAAMPAAQPVVSDEPRRPTPATSFHGRGRVPGSAPAARHTPVPTASPSLPDAPDIGDRLAAIVRDRIAGGLIDLPDLPGPTIRCIDLARQGRLGFGDAANIISDVPALRSRVMKLANSAAFPSRMPATTIESAISRIGAQGLVSALIEFAAREALEGRPPRVKEAMRRIWPHALGVAVMAGDMCQVFGHSSEAANGYLGGLLAQIGKPVVGGLLLEIEEQMQRAGKRAPIRESVLLSVMEASHHAAGAAVARHWDLSGGVAEAIDHARAWDAREPHGLSNVVRFAEVLTSRLGLTTNWYNGPELERAFGEGRALMRIDEVALRRLTHGFKERVVVLSGIRG